MTHYKAIIYYNGSAYEEANFDINQSVGQLLEKFAEDHELDESTLSVICQNNRLQDECIFRDLEFLGNEIEITVISLDQPA